MTKTILITGAAKRVGAEVAKALAAQGWRVAVHYYSSGAQADALADTIGNGAARFQADLQDEQQAKALIPRVVEQFGQLDAVIHNASLFEKDGLENFSWEKAASHMQLHAYVATTLAQQFAAHRTQYEAPASLILMGDGLKAWSHSAAFLSYGLSCSALQALPELLAEKLAPQIAVNAIACGLTLAESVEAQAQFARIAAKTPMQRTSSVQEVVATIEWLLAAPSVTGQVVNLAGGQALPRRISAEV